MIVYHIFIDNKVTKYKYIRKKHSIWFYYYILENLYKKKILKIA